MVCNSCRSAATFFHSIFTHFSVRWFIREWGQDGTSNTNERWMKTSSIISGSHTTQQPSYFFFLFNDLFCAISCRTWCPTFQKKYYRFEYSYSICSSKIPIRVHICITIILLVRESDSRRIQISWWREEKSLEIVMIHVVDLLKLGFLSHFYGFILLICMCK